MIRGLVEERRGDLGFLLVSVFFGDHACLVLLVNVLNLSYNIWVRASEVKGLVDTMLIKSVMQLVM